MWQVPAVPAAAVQVLTARPLDAGLTLALIDQFCAMQHHPRCLLPLLGHVATECLYRVSPQRQQPFMDVLISLLGDLDEVWADRELRETLLELPLRAMAFLLGSDKLQVRLQL
jgi:hypothetical protein